MKQRKRAVSVTTRKKHLPPRKQIVITISVPRFSEIVTLALLAGAFSGLLYAFAPLVNVPKTAVASQVAQAEVPESKQTSLKRSIPTRLQVPDVGIDTELIRLGKNPDGTLAVPERYDVAAWYELSPTPGEVGPSIISGHVDNYLGAAVFFRLRELQAGQKITVTRQDKSTVQFRVDKVELFDQQNFPTKAVYGNIDHPGLRLITCGGIYNPLTNSYSHNTVVYASIDE